MIKDEVEFNPRDLAVEDDRMRKAGPLDVMADDRERESGVIEYLQQHESIRVTVRRLELGDYLLNRRMLIQGLPGIGPALAERLLDTFGGVENVFRADADALSGVEGIGRKKAEAIRALIGAEEETRALQ